MKKLLCLFTLLVGLAPDLSAIDIPAASYRQADVNAAVALLKTGDNVIVPAFPAEGACWSEQSTWSMPPNTKIVFAGKDKSMIIDCYKPSPDQFHTAGALIAVFPSATGRASILGFKIKGRASSSNYKQSITAVYGQNKEFRMGHFEFDMTEAAYPAFNYAVPTAVEYYGHITGVMDHWVLNLQDRGALFVVHYNNYGGGNEGDESWAAPLGLGTSDFVFAEDGVINNPGAGGVVQDCYHAGKWVVRKLKLYGAGFGQTHPTGGSNRARGCRGWEAYDIETFPGANGKTNFNGFFLSSGSGVVHTIVSSGMSNFMTLHSMRVPGGSNYGQQPCPQGWGYVPSPCYDVGGSAFDQPGKGQSDLIKGPFPSIRNITKNCDVSPTCVPNQITEGVWIWNIQWTNPNMGGSEIAVYEGAQMVEGRDYHRTQLAGYKPFPYPHYLTLDGPPPAQPPVLSVSDVQVIEGNTGQSTVTMSVTKTGEGSATVNLATSDGTATAPSDYTAVNSTIAFASGDTTKTVAIPVLGDATIETNETFTVTLSNPNGATILVPKATVTITNDDVSPNMPPIIALMRLRNSNASGAIIDPTQPITVKNLFIQTAFSDDTGVSKAELRLHKGTYTQILKEAQGASTLTFTLNTNPYRAKGIIGLELVLTDADGAVTKQQLNVTVAK